MTDFEGVRHQTPSFTPYLMHLKETSDTCIEHSYMSTVELRNKQRAEGLFTHSRPTISPNVQSGHVNRKADYKVP